MDYELLIGAVAVLVPVLLVAWYFRPWKRTWITDPNLSIDEELELWERGDALLLANGRDFFGESTVLFVHAAPERGRVICQENGINGHRLGSFRIQQVESNVSLCLRMEAPEYMIHIAEDKDRSEKVARVADDLQKSKHGTPFGARG